MTKKPKLSLARETLRRLAGADLARVGGGTVVISGGPVSAEISRFPVCPAPGDPPDTVPQP
jgi:hypothetical protein